MEDEREHRLYVSTMPSECQCHGSASVACKARACPHLREVLVKGNNVVGEDGTELDKSLVKSARRLQKSR